MPKKRDGGSYVSVGDCVEHRRVSDMERGKISLALFGQDGRGGMVKDIGDIKSYIEGQKEGHRWWRQFLSTAIPGIIASLFAFWLAMH
jgi:hypothetical protein